MKRTTNGGRSGVQTPRGGGKAASRVGTRIGDGSGRSAERGQAGKRAGDRSPDPRSSAKSTGPRALRSRSMDRPARAGVVTKPDPEERLTDIAEPWNVLAKRRRDARTDATAGPAKSAEPVAVARLRAPSVRAPSRPKVPGPVHPDLQPRPRLSTSAVRAVAAGSKGVALGPTDNVQQRQVDADEDGMRLDRWLQVHFAGIAFSQVQRIIRKGELRVDGKRADTGRRLVAGQMVRVPPLRLEVQTKARLDTHAAETRAFLASITLWEDDDVLVLNKPMGLAVQGGSGTVRHIDGMLSVLEQANGQRPRLVHRIDKDTSGCLLIAKTRLAATALTQSFRQRSTRKVYWALVAGIPNLRQGRISGFLAKDEQAEAEGEAKMRVAEHGEEGAVHAVTYYCVVEKAARICAWVSLKPVTGRTHQLRAHMAHIGNPIVGDAKYFDRTNWELPEGMQNRLHLLARRIVVPHPRTGKPIDVTAPLPAHMQQSWSLLGFDVDRYDPIDEAPEE